MPGGDLPGFSYSVGIQRSTGAPEVIVVGLRQELSQDIVNENNRRAREGQRVSPGQFYDGFDVTFERVDRRHDREHFGWNRWLYDGDAFEALQLSYPTTSGVWPWDPAGPELFGSVQPRLTASGGREPPRAP